MDLAREDGEAFEPFDLGALDLAVPIGALDQPQHDPPLRGAREIDDPAERGVGAFLIGLDDEADAVPTLHFAIAAQRLQEIERKVEPLGFLGVDVDADVVAARQDGEALQARIEFVHHPPALARARSADAAPRA